MSEKENEGNVEVISSAGDAARAIREEKEKKAEMLKKIFDDNKTGRYGPSTDS